MAALSARSDGQQQVTIVDGDGTTVHLNIIIVVGVGDIYTFHVDSYQPEGGINIRLVHTQIVGGILAVGCLRKIAALDGDFDT